MLNQKLFLFVQLLLLSLFSLEALGSGDSGSRYINNIYTNPVGIKIHANPGQDWNNPDGCSKSNAIVIPNTHVNRDVLVSQVIASKSLNREMSAWLVNCMQWNNETFPVVYGIYFK